MYKFFNFLRTSSLWIAISAAFGPIALSQIYALPLPWWVPIAVLLATWAVYAIDKVSGSLEDLQNTPERAWLANWPIKRLAMIAYLAAIILVVASDIWRLPAILSFGFAGWIYARRIGGIRLKDLPGAKNVIVAAATSICYCGLLAAPFATYMLIFLLIWIGTVIFDLRDVAGDRANGVSTLPVILSTDRLIILLTIADTLLFVISPIVGFFVAIEILYFLKPRSNWQYDVYCDGWFVWLTIVIEILK